MGSMRPGVRQRDQREGPAGRLTLPPASSPRDPGVQSQFRPPPNSLDGPGGNLQVEATDTHDCSPRPTERAQCGPLTCLPERG